MGIPLSCFLALTIVFLPTCAFALAGIAERSSVFHFNKYAFIERGHPADICSGPTKWCLKLSKDGNLNFNGIDSTFSKINVPSNNRNPFIIGRLSSNNYWLIYDLQKEEIIISHPDYQKAIGKWVSLGMTQPTYVNPQNTRKLLKETRDSIYFRWKRDFQMWCVFALWPATVCAFIFWYLSRKSKQRYEKTHSVIYKVFVYVFLVPVFIIVYATMSTLISVIRQNL